MSKEQTVNKWQKLFYYFLLTAFTGYLYEYLLITFFYREKFVNGGPFHLPLLLIYGLGGTVIIMLLQSVRGRRIALFSVNIMPLIVASIILFIVCVVEYAGHYAIEAITGTKPWDYSNKFMNLNGRICLVDSLRFVALGIFGIYALVPIAEKLFSKMSRRQNNILFFFLSAIVCIDLLIWVVQTYS